MTPAHAELLDVARAQRRIGVAAGARMLTLIERLIAAEPDPDVRRDYRRQALEIRRTMIALITSPPPMLRPVTLPPSVVAWPVPMQDDHAGRVAVTSPIERGAP